MITGCLGGMTLTVQSLGRWFVFQVIGLGCQCDSQLHVMKKKKKPNSHSESKHCVTNIRNCGPDMTNADKRERFSSYLDTFIAAQPISSVAIIE